MRVALLLLQTCFCKKSNRLELTQPTLLIFSLFKKCARFNLRLKNKKNVKNIKKKPNLEKVEYEIQGPIQSG